MRRDLQDEAQAIRNVAEAIERVLRDAPEGFRLTLIWDTLQATGVSFEVYDAAVSVLLTQRRARVEGDRLFAGGAA